jgi:hypothetical protein
MYSRKTIVAMIAAALMATAAYPLSAQTTDQPARKSEPIYGYRMMTDQERNEYREKMRNARSPEERQAVRDEHHKAMQARAKERGVTLPDQPRGPGAGMGPGRGMGPGAGMGPGGGMGPGAGKGPGYGPGGGPGADKGPGPR